MLTIPVVYPAVEAMGFNLIWWSIAMTFICGIGFIIPPFGLNLFVLKGVVPKYEITYIFAGTLPFLIPTGVLIILLILFPDLVLWFPSFLYAR